MASLLKPSETYLPDCYVFHWEHLGVQFTMERFTEDKQDLTCRLKVEIHDALHDGVLLRSKVNTNSQTSKNAVIRTLNERVNGEHGIDWHLLVEQAALLAANRWEQGEPTLHLPSVEPRGGQRYLLPPLLEYNQPTVLFALGGAAKSLLALAACISIASGQPIFGCRPTEQGPVLYLDWESDEATHAERLRAICRAAGIDWQSLPVYYRRQRASLIDAIQPLRVEVARLGARLIVLDSLGLARGGEPESADATLRLFAAVHTLGTTSLAIDHLSKSHLADRSSPFGSIYTYNSARLVWRVDRAETNEAGELSVAYVCTKANNSQLQARFGMRLLFEMLDDGALDMVFFDRKDLRELPELSASMTTQQLVEEAIKANQGARLTVDEIVDTLEANGTKVSASAVRGALNRGRDRVFVQFQERSAPPRWALLARTGDF